MNFPGEHARISIEIAVVGQRQTSTQSKSGIQHFPSPHISELKVLFNNNRNFPKSFWWFGKNFKPFSNSDIEICFPPKNIQVKIKSLLLPNYDARKRLKQYFHDFYNDTHLWTNSHLINYNFKFIWIIKKYYNSFSITFSKLVSIIPAIFYMHDMHWGRP